MTVFMGELIDRLGRMVQIGRQMDFTGVLHTGRTRTDLIQKHIQRPSRPQMKPVKYRNDFIQGGQEIFRRTAAGVTVKIVSFVVWKRQ